MSGEATWHKYCGHFLWIILSMIKLVFSQAEMGGAIHKKIGVSFAFLAMVFFLAGTSSQALSQETANIAGTVLGTQGNHVEGVQIIVKDPSGKVVARASPDAPIQYVLKDLPLGQVVLTLDPGETSYQGGTVVAILGGEGLTVNWRAIPNREAIAVAKQGTESAGFCGFGDTSTVVFSAAAGCDLEDEIVAGIGPFSIKVKVKKRVASPSQ